MSSYGLVEVNAKTVGVITKPEGFVTTYGLIKDGSKQICDTCSKYHIQGGLENYRPDSYHLESHNSAFWWVGVYEGPMRAMLNPDHDDQEWIIDLDWVKVFYEWRNFNLHERVVDILEEVG